MYSHGMIAPAGEIVVVAGQVGMNRAGKVVGPGDVGAQTKQALDNVRVVLEAAGSGMSDVIRFQTFLTHASDIEGFMQARHEVFPGSLPRRRLSSQHAAHRLPSREARAARRDRGHGRQAREGGGRSAPSGQNQQARPG